MLLALGAVSCAPRVPSSGPAPGARAAPLPPVPQRSGPLAIDVVYPGEGSSITARDSNFIFGSLGNGAASLTINGQSVRVAPNGAWLAFLPVPADGVYEVSASVGGERVEERRTVRVPAAATAGPTGRAAIVEGSISPSGVATAMRGEVIQVRVRGTPGGEATLLLPDGRRIPLVESAVIDRQTGFMLDRAERQTRFSQYSGSFDLRHPILGTDTTASPGLAPERGHVEPEAQAPRPATIELVVGRDTVRSRLPATIALLEPTAPRVGIAATARADSTVIGRKLPGPGQPYRWFFPNGTRFEITGEAPGFLRIRLTEDLSVWVQEEDVRLLPAGTPVPRGEVGTIEVRPAADHARVTFSTTERLAYAIEPHTRGLTVTFYGASGRTGYMGYGRTDPFVERVWWDEPSDDSYRVHFELSEPLWGYQDGWDAGGNLEIRIRKPPEIDPRRPLQGLLIAVDAGHPPGGAIGPTRLTEADANLMVAKRLVPMLEAAGARVVEIRPDTAAVALGDRPIRAARSNAHLFVSIHFNAFPDGVNPFENHGTLVLHYWPFSTPFARDLQRELLAELGLPDRGVRFQDLAVARMTWMPSVLTETAFMMIPEIESALRDPNVQERIARAHFRGIEAFLRTGTSGTGR